MWARVDDAWWSHPKVVALPTCSAGLWVKALSWSCHQRKDIVPATLLPLFLSHPDEATALVDAGLWHVVEGGWRIHDWAEYQEKSVSEKRAEAGAKGGRASGESRRRVKQTGSNREAKAEAGPSLPIPSRPEGRGDGGVATQDEPLPPPEVVKANVPHVREIREHLKAVGE